MTCTTQPIGNHIPCEQTTIDPQIVSFAQELQTACSKEKATCYSAGQYMSNWTSMDWLKQAPYRLAAPFVCLGTSTDDIVNKLPQSAIDYKNEHQLTISYKSSLMPSGLAEYDSDSNEIHLGAQSYVFNCHDASQNIGQAEVLHELSHHYYKPLTKVIAKSMSISAEDYPNFDENIIYVESELFVTVMQYSFLTNQSFGLGQDVWSLENKIKNFNVELKNKLPPDIYQAVLQNMQDSLANIPFLDETQKQISQNKLDDLSSVSSQSDFTDPYFSSFISIDINTVFNLFEFASFLLPPLAVVNEFNFLVKAVASFGVSYYMQTSKYPDQPVNWGQLIATSVAGACLPSFLKFAGGSVVAKNVLTQAMSPMESVLKKTFAPALIDGVSKIIPQSLQFLSKFDRHITRKVGDFFFKEACLYGGSMLYNVAVPHQDHVGFVDYYSIPYNLFNYVPLQLWLKHPQSTVKR